MENCTFVLMENLLDEKKISSSSVLNVLLPINACHGAVPTGPSLMSAGRITKCLLEKVISSLAL